jgi:hypothetical protein
MNEKPKIDLLKALSRIPGNLIKILRFIPIIFYMGPALIQKRNRREKILKKVG